MRILNVHERRLEAPAEQVGALIDSLASAEDALWPHRSWPPMNFDQGIVVGAVGGHGPIGYRVEHYSPGRHIRFRFTRPEGFDGFHEFEVSSVEGGATLLRHRIEARLSGSARLTWPLVVRPLHDALLEDALTTAQVSLGLAPEKKPWSLWVRLIRWVMSRGRAPRRIR